MLGLDDPVEIDAEEARGLILSGKISSMDVGHSGPIQLWTDSGRRDPVCDWWYTLEGAVERVDPQHVFIGIARE